MILRFILLFCLALLPRAVLAADMRPFTDDLGRQVSIPVDPQRIISLYDVGLTIPLIELGTLPVGSHGRIGKDGKPTLRSGALLTGVDFDTSTIAFLGTSTPDLEAMVGLKPDLILTDTTHAALLPQLSRIAPVVVIDTDRGAPHSYPILAEILHAEPRLHQLQRRYAAQIARLKSSVSPQDRTVSVMQPLRGRISVYQSYRALGQVLHDAGFRFVPLMRSIPKGDRINISPARLPELDADYIFDPYRSDQGQGPETELERLNALLPGFCDYLQACRRGHLIMIPREEAISNSYAALGMIAAEVQASLSRPDPSALRGSD